jgi:hypothetical protein
MVGDFRVHMAAPKLKRISLNGPKVSYLGQRISVIKAEVAALLPEKRLPNLFRNQTWRVFD